jgi:hypothetical protein
MINLVLSVLMVLSSLLSLITTDSITTGSLSFSLSHTLTLLLSSAGVLACYVIVLSCLLCCYETHLKQISKVIALNFGFLFSAKSRSVFMIFIGSLLFSFSLFGKLVGCAMVANAFLNIFVLIKYPAFEDAQRDDAQNEITQFLQSNPALTKQAVSYTLQAGTDFARENPGYPSLPLSYLLTTHISLSDLLTETATALMKDSLKSPTFASV